MLRGSSGTRRLVLFAGPILALLGSSLLAGCGPLNPPQITAVSPSPSQGAVHTSDALVITFNTPMNKLSVERRLYLRTRKDHFPPDCSIARAAAERMSGCHFVWPSPRVMTLVHPHHPWATITTYRVALLGGIEAANGAVNPLSHSWEFSTEGGPQVSSTSPSSGGTLGPDQALSINFSRDMNPAAVRQGITLLPPPSGGYQLAKSSAVPGRFLLEPNLPLVPGTAYTLAIARSALDVDGNRLQRAAVVHFTVGHLGSTTTVVFPAGPSPNDYTEVLAASPPQLPGDPPALRVLATAPAGQHYLYSWPSPDGGRLAFEEAANQPIQVVDLRTSKSTTVLGSTGSDGAAWSPNGQQLAFVVGGILRVYTVANATSLTLATSPSMQGPLTWRPDGQVVAAVAAPAGDPTRVALLSPGLKAITFLPTSASAVAAENDPVWSPGGSSLAFAVGTASDPALWIYRPLDPSAPLSRVAQQAGQPLAFLDLNTILVQDPSGSLATVSTTTGSSAVIIGRRGGHYPTAAAATSVGRQVAFTLTVDGRVQVYLANDDGTGVEPLTHFSGKLVVDAGPPSFVGS
ncbi:MAG TPA: Ig-like domain-containing protein [Candidatus Dormibacteraeota bacterium]|nr:Ig-like domain-containing protein [Candidatus Dormibacteraeota bacterium]